MLFIPLTMLPFLPLIQLSRVQALQITLRNELIQQIICLLWAHLCISLQTLLQVEFALIAHDSITLEWNYWESTLDHLTIIRKVLFFMVRLLQKPPSPPRASHGNAYFVSFFPINLVRVLLLGSWNVFFAQQWWIITMLIMGL